MKQFNPLIQLCKLIKINKGQHPVNRKKIIPWLAKIMLTEPFRLFENITHDNAIREKRLCKDPIFILGHWRSGTSFLQYLVGKDPQIGYLSKFQAIFPELFLTSENIFKPMVKRISKSLETRDNVKDISVNWDWDSPSELDIALTTMCSPASPHWGHTFPHNHTYYFRKFLFLQESGLNDREMWKEATDYLIKKLSIYHDDKQLVVKSPGNTARVRYLLEMYPDAKFIYIHRNPYDVYGSNVKLWNVLLDNLSFQEFDKSELEQIIIDNYVNLLTAYMADRELIPKGNLAELRFEDFVQNPLEQMEKIYKKLNLPNFEAALPELRHFLNANRKGNSSGYKLDDDLKQRLNKVWSFSFKEWPYENNNKEKSEAGRALSESKDEKIDETLATQI